MNILVVGSGGREHAIVHSIAQAADRHEIVSAPGNVGTARYGRNMPIAADNVQELVAFAVSARMDLVVVGPEGPLVLGLADRLREKGIAVVGPSAAASRLEGSKAFSKLFMDRYGIPTAAYQVFHRSDVDAAMAYVRVQGAPIVVKASGLAAGKGAVVCLTEEDALEAVSSMFHDRVHGDAGDEIVIESFMEGEEASVFALTDGLDYLVLHTAQDHKQIGEGDTGLNTGGMGAYAPAPLINAELLEEIRQRVIEPTLDGMRDDGCPYSGFLYCGLMITADGPQVVEYNCRLGDPEAQVVLPLIKSDTASLFWAMGTQNLSEYELELSDSYAACVVLASAGYPGAYEKGKTVQGIEEATSESTDVYCAGLSLDENQEYVTSGGRVLSVTGLGDDLSEAIDRAYAAVRKISFEGQYYRRDIGEKGLSRSALI